MKCFRIIVNWSSVSGPSDYIDDVIVVAKNKKRAIEIINPYNHIIFKLSIEEIPMNLEYTSNKRRYGKFGEFGYGADVYIDNEYKVDINTLE